MRLEKVSSVLELARLLASSAEGMTIDDIASHFGASRRTAERMRDAVEATFGTLERGEDGKRVRFRLPAGGIGRFAIAPTAEEIAELLNLARSLKPRDPARARVFENLAAKISASLRESDRRRLAPDVESQLQTEVWAHTVGPREVCRGDVLAAIRRALLAEHSIKVAYRYAEADELHAYKLTPLGLIFGPRHYLVAAFAEVEEPRLLRLDRIEMATVLDELGRRPRGFNLGAYAERSFGLFQEEPRQIELIFDREVADEVRATSFHPRQTVDELEDGRVRVQFRAGGMIELDRYLARWGDRVRLVETLPVGALPVRGLSRARPDLRMEATEE